MGERHSRTRWQPERRRALALAALIAIAIGIAACSGSAAAPGAGGGTTDVNRSAAFGPAVEPQAAASAAPAAPNEKYANAGDGTSQNLQNPQNLVAPGDQRFIVKTGRLTLEVQDLDKAVTQAQTVVVGAGGYVADTTTSGDGTNRTAAITYRIPADRWDGVVAELRKLGSKVINEQSTTSDVTGQVVDVEARLSNLQTTERAFQAIMAKASTIPDILAVEQQLSQVQGEIEQLTAQRDSLKNQAAMSTLAVAYQLPGQPVVTTATTDWSLSAQIDEALAALVRIGQALATIGVWAAIVLLPIGLAILLVGGVLWLAVRRLANARPQPPIAPDRTEA